MALEIVWTRQAENGYDKIIKHLEENWTDREISNFIQETRQFLQILKSNPHLLEPSETRKYVYRRPINPLTILTYRIKPHKQVIELLNIRGAGQKPKS